LRIGKKKADDSAASSPTITETAPASPAPDLSAAPSGAGADDWSDFGNIPNETVAPDSSMDSWTSFDDLVESPDATPTNSVAMPAVAVPPAESAFGDTPVAPPAKRSIPKVALVVVPLLLAGAGGAAYFLTQSPPVDEMAAVVPERPHRRKPPAPPAKQPVAKVAAKPVAVKSVAVKPAGVKPGVPKPGVAKPAASPTKAPVKVVATKTVVQKTVVTKTAAVPVNATRVATRPSNVEAVANAAAMTVPVPPKSANPGVTADPNRVDFAPPVAGAGAARRPAAPSNMTAAQVAKRTRLKALWNDGAEAKRRGDKATARRIWTQGLKQAEAAPRLDASAAGFRGSLAKL
jgi:hypothetical protein